MRYLQVTIGVRMKTNPIINEHGKIYAFEIRNDFVSLRRVIGILKSINGISDIYKPKWRIFFNRTSVKLEFSFEGVRYVVMELHGDSDAYWIGPKDIGVQNDGVLKIEAIFRAASTFRIVEVMRKILKEFSK